MGQTTVEVRVAHNDDDATEDDQGQMTLNSGTLELGEEQWVGVRFLGLGADQGACISSAYVQFRAQNSDSGNTDLTIFGEDADSAARFGAGANNISNRTPTTASVTWNDVEPWTSGDDFQTLDITNIVQEIVDRSGWSSGNDIVILVRSDDLGGRRRATAHDATPSTAPLLHVEIAGTSLQDHSISQETDAFTESGGETDAELFAFRLIPCPGSNTVTQLVFRLTDIAGLVDGDWGDVELVVDTNGDGNISVSETTTVGGAGVVSQAAGTITFSTSFTVSAATHYMLRATFASLSDGDRVRITLADTDITSTGGVAGSTSSVTHIEGCLYVERFQAWTATSAGAWETKDLNGSPFFVPAGATAEVAVRNSSTTNERLGGVRAVGSSLTRRLQLHQALGGGTDLVVMHVRADSASRVEHYAENATNVDFALLGFWSCGTYVERFDSLTAGASASWQDAPLCAYGVGPGYAAELLMTNSNATAEREAGVRTNGSSLARTLNLHDATGGGVDTASMIVRADSSTSAYVELYAQVDADIGFNLLGYWSTPPLAYTEAFATAGSPTVDATWQDVDLTSAGVPDGAVAEFALENDFATGENNMGVRTNGSSLARLLNIHDAAGGGGDFGRLHVLSDSTATIEFYHQDVSDAHTFRVLGYWDTCDAAVSYVIADLGAITAAQSSLAHHVNSSGKVAGFDEDSSGNPTAWYSSCGTFTSLGTLGGSYAESLGINNANRVVGWAHNASGKRRAFTWSSGSMTDLGVILSRNDSEALAVNASSEVVGTVLDFTGPPTNRLAFLYLPVAAYTLSAGMNSLGTLGGSQSVGMDINDSGQVVGGAQNASGNFRPFRWELGTMTNLGTLGGESTRPVHRAEAINAFGDTVGRSYTAAGAARAFLYDGIMTNLGVLTGGTESWAFGVNDSEAVVGTSNVTGGAFHAFVWDSTNGMLDLNNLIAAGSGWTLIRAMSISNDGTIVGWGTNPSSNTRAFLLTQTCSSGGGGAVAGVLAAGSGTTGVGGTFQGILADADGAPMATVELATTEIGIRVEYELRVLSTDSHVQSDASGQRGLAEVPVVPRTFHVEAGDLPVHASVTVSMRFAVEEILEREVDPADLMLHVLTPSGNGRTVWLPAGKAIGESPPTGVVGEAGYVLDTDDSVVYWAVRNSGGTFAVSKPLAVDVASPATQAPRLCGIGAIPPLLLNMTVFALLRTRRRDPFGLT